MSHHCDPLDVETKCRALFGNKSEGVANILERARPSPARIPDPTILNIEGRKSNFSKGRAKVPCMLKVVAGSPKPSVDIHNDRPRLLRRWKSQISEVEWS
jgi:hypothetical protein